MLSGLPKAPVVLPTARLAEALAVLVVEIAEALPVPDRDAALERITNRLDGYGRTTGGSQAAIMLGAVGAVLMGLER